MTIDHADDRASHQSTANALKKLRDELINIGALGNSLVNFRESGRFVIKLKGANADKVFERLVGETKSVQIKAVEPELIDADATSESDSFQETSALLAPSDPGVLASKLSKIQYEATSQLQEMGYESLYLALGKLSYSDDDAGTQERAAPLVLIPVTLVRSPAGRSYSVVFNQEDIGRNIALHGRLEAMFGIGLPELSEDSVPSDYFDAVQGAIAAQSGWRVQRDSAYLGFFSFTSFQMVRDLDEENWEPEDLPSANPILKWLLGGQSAPPFAAPDTGEATTVQGVEVPKQLEPMVLDADASQMDAIQKVAAGGHLVIQGPPGTGKSQTITNIIANAVAQGKKVLFVAEKLAALEVVKRRLDSIGLGEIALELHSYKSNKRAVHEQLRSAWESVGDLPDAPSQQVRQYTAAAERLTAYADATEVEIHNSGLNYVEVSARLDAIRSRNPIDINLRGIEMITADKFEFWLSKVHEFTNHVQLMMHDIGDIDCHPLRPVTLTSMPVEVFDAAQSEVARALKLIDQVGSDLYRVATALDFEVGRCASDVTLNVEWARRALASPALQDVRLGAQCWSESTSMISEAIGIGREISEIRDRLRDEVAESTWGLDLSPQLVVWRRHGRSWLRLLRREYRETKAELRQLLNPDAPNYYLRCSELMEAVCRHGDLQRRFRQLEAMASSAFGSHWRGVKSDWDELEGIAEWAAKLNADVKGGSLPNSALGWTVPTNDLPFDGPSLDEVVSNVAAIRLAVGSVNERLGFELIQIGDHVPLFGGSESVQDQLTNFQSIDYLQLSRFLRYNELVQTLVNGPFGDAIDHIVEQRLSYDTIEASLRARRYLLLAESVRFRVPAVRDFNSMEHDHARQAFAAGDRLMSNLARKTVIETHRSGLPEKAPIGEVRVLQTEMAKKRRHLSIRALIDGAGTAIQQIAPVFMMSPMSVAKFLKPGSIRFDLVVFDEASQMRTPDAIGAILRADQVVVVGDDKQLPPTRFFMQHLQSDTDDFEDDDDPGLEGLESVLDLLNAKSAGDAFASLLWHYRSRHEGLITFSNQKFYRNRLVTVPAPVRHSEEMGLKFRHRDADVYLPGQGPGLGINRGEADRIAQRVVSIAEESPNLSLGVVAFSIKQRDAIIEALDALTRHRRDLDAFFDSKKPEPFFVKNLENVQGDERDVILISVGYGRTRDGKVPMRFGPINQAGGERRLNVLVTRAKYRMEVFANFTADDMKTTPTSSAGLVALKEFLAYAKTGRLDVPVETGTAPDSIFEEQVAQLVRDLGYEAEAQVGASSYRIDVGVRSRHNHGRYILGIECDGAMYHSSSSARDRDRLRQEVLEKMGWRIFRIWSTTWFSMDRARRREMLKAAIEDAESHEAGSRVDDDSRSDGSDTPEDGSGPANSGADSGAGFAKQSAGMNGQDWSNETKSKDEITNQLSDVRLASDEPGSELLTEPGQPEVSDGVEPGIDANQRPKNSESPIDAAPYAFADVSFLQRLWIPDMWASMVYLPRALEEIAKVEGPVHVELAARRIADAVGVKRTGRAVRACADAAQRSSDVIIKGDFISTLFHEGATVRDYSAIPSRDRKIQYVPSDEIRTLLLANVKAGIRVGQDEAIRHTLKVLGFVNSKTNIPRIRQILSAAIRGGSIIRDGDLLRSA